jgi:hypothetical protein
MDPTPRRRSPALRLAAAWLAVTGALAIFYAPLVPLLPPLVTRPVPFVSAVIGVVGLAAAVGVWQRRDWGRWLGLAMMLWRVVGWLGSLSGLARVLDSLDAVPQLVVSGAWLLADLVVIWVLWRRWSAAVT